MLKILAIIAILTEHYDLAVGLLIISVVFHILFGHHHVSVVKVGHKHTHDGKCVVDEEDELQARRDEVFNRQQKINE